MRPDGATAAYAGRLVRVTVERWGDAEREVVEHPGSVAVVAVDVDGCVALVRQLREPARRALLELPAGTLEQGEEPLACAKRELAEETGLRGGRWRRAATFWTTPGFCRERMHLFVAEGVVPGDRSAEDDEAIELVRWPVAEIEARVGELEDAKTIAGLLLYASDVRDERGFAGAPQPTTQPRA